VDASAQTSLPGLADSLARLGTETAFSVLARARELERQGREIIHLEIGEPDFDTPVHVRDAAAAALAAGETHYCPSAGIPELREEAARFLARTRGVHVDPANVLVGTGAKPFLFFGILATCNPGDEVVYPDPGFPIYESAIRWAGATPVPLPLLEERDFAFDLADLESRLSPRTKLVILNSPQNPTGGALSREQTTAAATLLADSGAWVLSDEVYSQMVYDGAFASVASYPGMLERTILLDGLSKTYAMTGWRCGFAAVPEPLVDPLVRFFVNSTSCVPPFVQLAGVAALSGPQDEPRAMVEEFRARRELVVAGLNELPGVSCRMPRGAFYAFPNVSGVPLDADELADRLLQEAGVAVLAGSAFGDHGRDNLRISYANSRENLALALERIGDFLAAL
jgi:aspartate/methionine/tyrosine aminotransferase